MSKQTSTRKLTRPGALLCLLFVAGCATQTTAGPRVNMGRTLLVRVQDPQAHVKFDGDQAGKDERNDRERDELHAALLRSLSKELREEGYRVRPDKERYRKREHDLVLIKIKGFDRGRKSLRVTSSRLVCEVWIESKRRQAVFKGREWESTLRGDSLGDLSQHASLVAQDFVQALLQNSDP